MHREPVMVRFGGADWEDLLTDASHQLLSPLGAIKGYASALLNLGPELSAEEAKRFLEGIEQAADKASQLVNNLLETWCLGEGQPQLKIEPTSLYSLVRQVVAEFKSRTRAADIRTMLSSNLPKTEVDPGKLRLVLLNLLDNARKYSPEGKVIWLTASQVESSEELAEALGSHASTAPSEMLPCVLLSVRDEGVGIPKDEIHRIFDKFYRVDAPQTRGIPGAGLGLYLCRRIVEAHGGYLWAESELGNGSTFKVLLHVSVGARARERAEAASRAA